MGWQPPISQQGFRFLGMEGVRLNKRIFDWCNAKCNSSCNNWCYIVRKKFDLHLNGFSDKEGRFCKKRYVHDISEALLTQEEMCGLLSSIMNGAYLVGGQNKLRTYRLMKREYKTQNYCLSCLPLKHRSAFAKFRCEVDPIRIETGRNEGLDVDSRTCPICKNGIEDEKRVILQCSLYDDIRKHLFDKAANVNENFIGLSDTDKLVVLFTNVEMIKFCAKLGFQILQKRQNTLFN